MRIWLEKVHLDLKVNWKLSRSQTNVKENFIVHLETSIGQFHSEIAPNTRYGETVENIQESFNDWSASHPVGRIDSLETLSYSLRSVSLHALHFGLESVFLSWMARSHKKSLAAFLGLPEAREVETSFSMPIIPVGEIAQYLGPIGRFKSLKIKVNAESGEDMLREIRKYTNVKIRVDANEGWQNLQDYLKFESTLKGMNIELIEQPFPSTMIDEYKELKKRTPYKILADESIEDVGDFNELSKQFHAVNIKLMKTGSLIKARDLILEAKSYGMESMMGCMIETSLGISYGMLFTGIVEYVDLDGFLLLKNEPYSLVHEKEGTLKLSPSAFAGEI